MTEWHPDYFKKLVKEAIRELQQEDQRKALGDDNYPMHKTIDPRRVDRFRKEEQKREFDEAQSLLDRYHAKKKMRSV